MYRLLRFANVTTAGKRLFSSDFNYISSTITGNDGNVGLIKLNRPKELNALSSGMVNELVDEVHNMNENKSIGTIIITGEGRAFAAGADIKEMAGKTMDEVFTGGFLRNLDNVAKSKKPIIAAVNGFALGGGCEMAMMCDIIYASDKAKFGQPEIKLGTIPGAGGSQRFTRAVGKSKAMEAVLSGIQYTAEEAVSMGIAARVYPHDQLLPKSIEMAELIASHSKLIVQMAKEAVNGAFETTLEHGCNFEKQLFYATFGSHDRKEGMAAFVARRPPKFEDK